MTIKIEQISIHEMLRLMEISEETYRDTFAGTTDEESLNQYIETAYNFYQLKEEIANKNSLFFFAYRDDDVLAYMKLNINDAQTEDIDQHLLEIERIYIPKPYQKQGLGRALYEKTVEIAQILGKKAIWLGVYEYSEKAKAFYKKLGFERMGARSFVVGTDEQTDIIVYKKIE